MTRPTSNWRRALVVVLAVAILPFALVGTRSASGTSAAKTAAATSPAPTRACRSAAASPAGVTTERFLSGGRPRQAVVDIPITALGRPAPLLLAFHGSGGTGPFMRSYSGFAGITRTSGFVGVYPTASGPRWNLEESEDPTRADDVRFVRELIDRLGARVCFDKTRVYVAGVSNGGGFAALLGCRLSRRIAAVATVAGGYGDLPECHADRPVSVLEVHGTEDKVVPYDGRDGRGAARDFAGAWAARDGCPADARERTVAFGVVRYDWWPCDAGSAVAHVKLVGGAHQWPGATPPDPGPRSPFATAPEIWRFVSHHRLALPAH
ncbi:MAG: polyhydroxybutyrate depolymerase [Thermoleophilales bacterium]|nr:polyhydroxybutyrate depolymerase [Thermoleophilales bacterium]